MKQRRLRGAATTLALTVACGVMAGCADSGTTLFLEVDVSRTPGVQQLHVSGRTAERLVFGPAVRPERPGDALEGVQTLRILLPDEAAGAPLTVQVDGLVDGSVLGRATGEVQPGRSREAKLQLALEPAPSACSNCGGCCQTGQCIEGSVTACGAGGVQCFACDPVLADRCSAEGRCQCGEGPACSPGTGADRCVGGECRCGNNPACPSGTQCDNGVCRCTPDSCAGCCSNNQCLSGTSEDSCGAEGAACGRCDDGTACTQGQCR